MKWGILLGLLAVPFILLVISDEADATCTNSAQPNANVCKGFAEVGTTTGGVSSGRCFAVSVEATASLTCTTGGVGSTTSTLTWQMAAGDSITMRYDDVANGGVPPAVPNKVSLDVRFDNTNTVIRTFLANAAEPANGATYTFYATSDGTSTGSPRAGTYRVLLTAVKDNGVGGVGNYAINSDGVASVGVNSGFHKGSLQGQIQVSSVARSAYPSGSMFAYGASGDESITLTGTFTTQNGDANVETARTLLIDAAATTTYQVGATVDPDSTTLAQNYVVDNTFPVTTANHYTGAIQFNGNSVLTGALWTTVAATGHGTNIVADAANNAAYDSTGFSIDSRIRMDSDTTGGFATADQTDRSYVGGTCSGTQVDLFNRGEGICTAWSLVNARDEYLSRAMTHARRDTANTVCASYGSLSPSSNIYTVAGTLSTSLCIAASDTTGTARHLLVTNTDQSYTSGTIFFVSQLLFIDTHLQDDATLVTDDYPTEDAAETLLFFVRSDGGGGDDSDTIYLWCGVQGVRKDNNVDTTGTAVSANIMDPLGATRDSGTGDTESNGFTGSPTGVFLLASTPLGDDWEGNCSATYLGNTGSDTEVFEVGVEGGGGETVYTGADPLTIFAGSISNGTVPIAIHSRMLDGEARVGAAASIFVSVFEWPSMASVITGASVVEVDATNAPGAYAYNFTPPYPGSYLVSANTTDGATDIGAHNVIQTASLLDHSDNSLEVSMTSNFAGLGFDGFLLVLFWIAAILFFSYMGWLVALAFAVPGLLQTVIPELPFDFTTYLLLCLLGFILEVAANKWSWGGYQSGKRRLKIGV